jgi:hypothetical protein
MSIADGTWFLAEHPKDMVESLDDGIRGLLVDTWYGQPTEDGGAITAPESLAGAEAELTATYGKEVVASIQRTIDRVRRSEPSGPTEPYFCHTVCEIGSEFQGPVVEPCHAGMGRKLIRWWIGSVGRGRQHEDGGGEELITWFHGDGRSWVSPVGRPAGHSCQDR